MSDSDIITKFPFNLGFAGSVALMATLTLIIFLSIATFL